MWTLGGVSFGLRTYLNALRDSNRTEAQLNSIINQEQALLQSVGFELHLRHSRNSVVDLA